MNESPWHFVIQNYYVKIINVVYYLTEDHQLAQDIAQESFVIAMEKFHQLKDLDKFLPWLTAIAINLARTHVKRNQRNIMVSDIELNASSTLSDNCYKDLDEHLDSQEFIKNAMPRLSMQEQYIIIMRYYLDMKEKDIASAMGIRVGTVKKQLFRARSKLLLEYQAWYGKGGAD